MTGGTATAVAWVAENIVTGKPNLDRMAIRYRVALYAVTVLGLKAATDLRYARALMAIVNNETGGAPPYIGDAGAKGGPSIGPMQVYRATAKDLKLWTPTPGWSEAQERAEYSKLAGDEERGIRWGVQVFKAKLAAAQGNIPEAVRRYNGAGERAEAYRARALDFYSSRWGALT